jgi:hypothetical protein
MNLAPDIDSIVLLVAAAYPGAEPTEHPIAQTLLGLNAAWMWLVGLIVILVGLTLLPGLFSKK